MVAQAEGGVSEGRAGPVGYVGLGIMGLPMVRNLLEAGWEVVAWNRSPAPLAEAVGAGATPASSAAEVTARARVVFLCLTASADVEEVMLGAGGVAGELRPDTVVVDMSTISPSVTRRLSGVLAGRGATLLDAPVSGGEQGAVAGTLSIMVGGPREALERVRPLLEILSETITHCGPVGSGQTVKLCNQVAVALNNLAMAEALLLCAASGVDPRVMLAAITRGAAGSWQLSNLGPRILERDFTPGFKVSLQQKDLRLALEASSELSVPLAGTSLVHQLFAAVERRGYGEAGTQALVTALEAMAGIDVATKND